MSDGYRVFCQRQVPQYAHDSRGDSTRLQQHHRPVKQFAPDSLSLSGAVERSMSVRSIQTATTLLLLTANSQHNRSTGREWQMHGEPMPHAATRGDISHVRPLDSVDHGRRDTKAHKPRLPRRISARSSLTRVLPGATASQAADRRLLTEVARGKADRHRQSQEGSGSRPDQRTALQPMPSHDR